MDIEQALKSDDEEIILLYANIAIEKYTVNEVDKMLNKKYFIKVDNGYFYLHKNLNSKINKLVAKLNFTFKKK